MQFSLEYWYMLPIATVVAIFANSSGFSGGVLFQPIFYFFLNVPLQSSVATGIATETAGMTSGTIRYFYYRMIELPIGFTMIMLTIPGIVIGNYILLILDGNFIKLILAIILLFLASLQLYRAIIKYYGTKKNIPVEDIYGFMWIPPISGFFSSATGTGICEISQPLLERGMDVQTKRANATAIMVEAAGDWVISILNLHAGLIRWDILIFTATGVIMGAQIGSFISRFMPERIIKIIFSIAIVIIGIFYILQGAQWLFDIKFI